MATGGAHDRPTTWVLGLDVTSTRTVAASRAPGQAAVVLEGLPHGPEAGVSAAWLGLAYGRAVGRTGCPPGEVRLACPATWTPARRQRLLDDAVEAGLAAPVVVLAPVAAALAYADRHAVIDGSYLLVCRLDHEHFEGAVVQASSSGYEPIGPASGGRIGIGTTIEHDAGLARAVAQLGELEDVEGLTPDWISTVLIVGDDARIPTLRRLLADSHPGAPIHDRNDVASAVSIGATHPLAALAPRCPPADTSCGHVLVPTPVADAFEVLNTDWDFDARQHSPDAGPLRRRRLAMAGTAVLTLISTMIVLSDATPPGGRSAWSPVASPPTVPLPPAMDPQPAGHWILPEGYPPGERPLAMVGFDAVLTHLDVKREWDENIAGARTDLGHVCGRRAPNLALISIRRRFTSSTGDEKLANAVSTFTNPVTAQASLMEVERNFAACADYETSDNGRSVRIVIIPYPPAQRPRHGEAAFAVSASTAEGAKGPTSVLLYGVVRHDRYVTEVEYSATTLRRGTQGRATVSDAHRHRFEQMLRRASDRLERIVG